MCVWRRQRGRWRVLPTPFQQVCIFIITSTKKKPSLIDGNTWLLDAFDSQVYCLTFCHTSPIIYFPFYPLSLPWHTDAGLLPVPAPRSPISDKRVVLVISSTDNSGSLQWDVWHSCCTARKKGAVNRKHSAAGVSSWVFWKQVVIGSVTHAVTPHWEPLVVLESLSAEPFKPNLPPAILLNISKSVKRLRDLCALLVHHPNCSRATLLF